MDYDMSQKDKCPPPPPCDCTYEEFKREVVQSADLTLPVEIEPSATVGRIEADCSGDPIVVCSQDPCRNVCRVTITQRICVKIPITYGVLTCVEDPTLKCCTGGSRCE